MKLYSDLIIEANSPLTFTSVTNSKFGIDIAEHDVNENLSKRINRKVGKYVSLFLDDDTKDSHIQTLLSSYIKKMCSYLNCTLDKTLVVRLGNGDYIVDSLGERVTEKLNAKEHKLMSLVPNVNAKTGIESSVVIKSICKSIQPTVCLVIDSIATISLKRLAKCYQLTSAGIAPGGGVSTSKKIFIDQSYLDCPIISIGVPLIFTSLHGFTMPYNIEDVLNKTSLNISTAINSFF